MPSTRRKQTKRQLAHRLDQIAWLTLGMVVVAAVAATAVVQPQPRHRAQLVSGGPQTFVETFSTTQFEDINYTTADWRTSDGTLTLHENALAEQALSFNVDVVTDKVATATLDLVRSGGGSVESFLSNDGGQTWEPVTVGMTHAFGGDGSKLRWKLVLSRPTAGDAVPVIDELRITYEAQLPSQVVSINAAEPAALAVAVSRAAFEHPHTAEALLIARGDDPIDAFAATSFAAAVKAPMLLTSAGRIDEQTMAEARRVTTGTDVPVYVLGGPLAVPDAAVGDMQQAGFGNTARLAGDNRFSTAARIAEQVVAVNPSAARTAFVTEASALVDAFAAGPAASQLEDGIADVILLVARGSNRLPAATEQFLRAGNGVTALAVVGGEASITAAAEDKLRSLLPGANVVRLAGTDRFETADEVASARFAAPTSIVLADGTFRSTTLESFGPLLGGMLAAGLQAPLLLTDDGVLPLSAQAYLLARRESIDVGYLVAVPIGTPLAEQVRNII